MTRYIIATDILSARKQDAITLMLQGEGTSVAHYLPTLWLVVDKSGKRSLHEIRDALRDIIRAEPRESNHFYVFEPAPGSLMSGYGNERELEWVLEVWQLKTPRPG
jgi:hypothetical protein